MREQLLINVRAFETRVALLDNNVLAELHIARASGYSLTGNLYNGRVDRIMPGMQAAFVDVGLARPGFLHARDIDQPRILPGDEAASPRDIRSLVHEGQSVLVQVAKDPISGKGARLTTGLAIASRYLVLMPCSSHVGISQRIEDEAERDRLKETLTAMADGAEGAGHGFIVRTAAEGVDPDKLAADVDVLRRIWRRIEERAASAGTPALVYEELPVHIRAIRDLAGPELTAIVIDDAASYQRVRDFVDEFLPEFGDRVKHYDGAHPLFDRYGAEEEIERALSREVKLKSGGYLVIEQTEAMTTIDVNTGGYLGARNLEDTVYRTNLEAAAMIPRQLRLRNLGGIIVVDFIDMEDDEHRRQVMRALEKACEGDPARLRLSDFSHLGLIEMSRKRTRESLVQRLCEPCRTCDGLGIVKTAETVCHEIFRAILRHASARGTDGGEYLVRAAQPVVDRLLDEEARHVACLASEVDRAIRFQVEPSYGPENFDVVLVQGVSK